MKCPHCKKAPYPLKREDGSINWKNVLRPDWYSLWMVLIILLLAWSYSHDIKACDQVINDPKGYCGDYCKSISGGMQIEEPGYQNFTIWLPDRES